MTDNEQPLPTPKPLPDPPSANERAAGASPPPPPTPAPATAPTPAAGDPTKTKRYAYTDLSFKGLQVVLVGILGLVGWRLQSQNGSDSDRRWAADRAAAEHRRNAEQEEQRLLPMFDSLAAIEFTLDEAIAAEAGTPGPQFYTELADTLSWRLMSVYVPTDAAIHINLPISTSLKIDFSLSEEVTRHFPKKVVKLPVRSALGLSADFLRMAEYESRIEQTNGVDAVGWHLDDDRAIVLQGVGPGLTEMPPPPGLEKDWPAMPLPVEVRIDPEFVPAWKTWLPPDGESILMIESGAWRYAAHDLLVALRREVARVQRDALTQHPALAEKYIAIRTNVFTNKTYRQPRAPSSTPNPHGDIATPAKVGVRRD